jgi:tRNA pseudouridine38-40 synthase
VHICYLSEVDDLNNMRRIVLTIEYDGTAFHGWQIQPEVRTVQGEIRDALTRMMGEKIKVVGSGRTDAGVHAAAQVAHADVPRDIPARNIMLGLNSDLDSDVRIIHCRDAEDGFHAQYSATGKTYRYRLLNSQVPTALDRHRTWQVREPLDIERMKEAAGHLEGEHDFTSFRSAGDESTTVRELKKIEILKEGEEIRFYFAGSGFLKHMVRNMVGALVEVGSGNLTAEELKAILEAKTRDNAPPKAPPQGLMLLKVEYE